MAKFTTKFDNIYREQAPDVPVAYLQALAGHESSNNPKERKGCCWGLLQVSNAAVTDYNKAKGTNFKRADALDPVLNVKIFYVQWKMFNRVFQRLIRDRGLPLMSNFVEDWSNRQYALLVTMAWNSGIGAVAFGVKHSTPRALEPLRMKPLTAVDVAQSGRRVGTKKMRKVLRLAKIAYQAKVVGSYFGLMKGIKEGLRVPTEVTFGGVGKGLLLVVALLVFFGKKRGRR